MKTRAGGILLHISSLPSPYGVGDVGPEARAFAEFLHRAGQTYWQILPVHPTDLARQSSPYVSDSAFAGNPLFISPELLVEEGRLTREDLDAAGAQPSGPADYHAAAAVRRNLLETAFNRFEAAGPDRAYTVFRRNQEHWLEDYALFAAIKEDQGGRSWIEWPESLRRRDSGALDQVRDRLSRTIERNRFIQFIFQRQWNDFRRHCRNLGLSLIGDLPIYVHYDSTEVWAHPEIFKLDDGLRPRVVAGVPPDYFSETGQLWGNPLYNWDRMRSEGYDWWLRRCARELELVDFVRIDHFRGLVGYWEVPADHETALNGYWVEAPAYDFLRTLSRRFPALPFLAEDLGHITPDVTAVKDRFRLPGMKVLLFAFGDDVGKNPFAPHNHERNCVVYTGTHDNNTSRAWFESEARPEEKEKLFRYLGRGFEPRDAAAVLVRLAWSSPADTAIAPMQDVLGLGGEARMNRPSGRNGNWLWRLSPGQVASETERFLRELTETYGRG